MYSSSTRGRSPASYCASSAARAGEMRRSSLIGPIRNSEFGIRNACSESRTNSEFRILNSELFRHLPQRLLERRFKPSVGHRLDRGGDGLFSKRPMIPQVHERREHIVAHSAWRGLHLAGNSVFNLHTGQPIFQLEHDALGCLPADAWNRREPCDV